MYVPRRKVALPRRVGPLPRPQRTGRRTPSWPFEWCESGLPRDLPANLQGISPRPQVALGGGGMCVHGTTNPDSQVPEKA